MSLYRPLLAAGLAALFGGLAWRLRRIPAERRGSWVDTLLGASAFLALVFLLKGFVDLGRPTGLLRNDFLFPLWARYEIGGGWWWFGPALGIAGAILLAWRAGWLDRMPLWCFFPALASAAVTVWICFSLSNGGWPEGLTSPFRRDADYFVDVARFDSIGDLWGRYVAIQPELSLHGRTHPPGALTFLFLLQRLFGGHLTAIALATVMTGVSTLLPIYLWVRALGGDARARSACVVWIFLPAVLLYGATCMDMVFAAPLVAAAAVFFTSLATADDPRAARSGALAGLFLGLGFLFTFSASILAVLFAVMTVPPLAKGGKSGRAALLRLATAGVACLACVLLPRAATGFDVFACLATAVRLDAADTAAFLSPRYYVVTRLMGVLDFLVLAGVAASPAWIRALSAHDAEDRFFRNLGRATMAVAALFLALGAFKIGETGRIGLFLMPAVVLPMARPVGEAGNRNPLPIALLGLLQAALFEFFLDTRW